MSSEPLTALPVQHLFSAHLDIGTPSYVRNGPAGTKIIVAITGGTITGQRINGTIVPNSGGDWVSVGADGSMRIDVRFTILTDDDATIYVSYLGVLQGRRAIAAPLFETGAEQYAWLNASQGIGLGNSNEHGVDYEFYLID
ncbi:MAG: hypothetical protein JWL72_3958 [Ilumatobacteraceae bacterium]|nr:hypothetical protein [Ilumatobacteraceae bacterium]MCU1390620.1 hypothetical protein [Ilumatobacteraceae bacterium]